MSILVAVDNAIANFIGAPHVVTTQDRKMLAQIWDDAHLATLKLLNDIKSGTCSPTDTIASSPHINSSAMEILKHVDQNMTIIEFLVAEADGFDLWPFLLAKERVQHNLWSSLIKTAIFNGNNAGWNTYHAWAQQKVAWF